MELAKGVGRLFYIISPNETAVQNVEDIPHPNYFNQSYPYFVVFLIIEILLQKVQNKPLTRINDGLTSASLGMMWEACKILVRGVESYFYIKIYENWRMVDLPWDSPSTWYLAAIGVDFFYYWFHRGSHEINFFWTSHQVHHSSEDYNLTTALRQSAIQGWISWIFYLPLAFFVPPSIFIIHQQFNLLYQFWIHTEVIDNIGPLEYVLNTPRHHRIHHGSNRYCLDKNYAGFLIIWDRIFGTFEEEKPGEKIVYGLVEDVKSFNPFWLQYFYGQKLLEKATGVTNLSDKFSAILKGPGWFPGKPRLGDLNDVPVYPTRDRYHIKLPIWKNAYVIVHFLAILLAFDYLSKNYFNLNQIVAISSILYIVFCLTSIGLVLENRKLGSFMEIGRGLSALLISAWSGYGVGTIIGNSVGGLFIPSILALGADLVIGGGNQIGQSKRKSKKN